MAKILDHGDDSVHLQISGKRIWLTIGLSSLTLRDARGKNRQAILTKSEARKLAYALLSTAEDVV